MIKYSQNNENGLVLHAAFTFKASKLNDKFVYYYVSIFSLSIKKTHTNMNMIELRRIRNEAFTVWVDDNFFHVIVTPQVDFPPWICLLLCYYTC